MTYKIDKEEGEFIRKFFPIFGVGYCRKKLNKTTSQIESYVLNNNIKSNRNYNCNIRDYLDIDNPNVIYTLGFLWADGSLSKSSKNSYLISVTVTKRDEKYLKKVLKKWNDFKWGIFNRPAFKRIYKGQEINGKPCTNFYLSDKYISTFLVNNDYLIKSGASADKIISQIKTELKYLFFRGYFDGDGSISYNNNYRKVQFSSCREQDWTFIIKLCKELFIHYAIYKKSPNKLGNSSVVEISRVNDCIRFLDYIYQNRENDNIGYTRKYNRYKQFDIKPIIKTSQYKGVCFNKFKKINPWVSYYKGKYIGCSNTPENALKLRENHIQSIIDKNANTINQIN